MKRRDFIQSSAIAGAIPATYAAGALADNTAADDKELYELRTYSINLRGNYNLLLSYLKDVLKPHMMEKGVNGFMMFSELGNAEPRQLWVMISYPTSDIYVQAQGLTNDPTFIAAAKDYAATPATNPIFSRYTSSLLLAFDGMPKMSTGRADAGLYELRTYEGYSEDAVRRKVAMFNDEELPLFVKTKLYAVFFAEMIAGPHRPSLVYMLNFKDMAERDANWSVFANHPEWKEMVAKEKYADSVSRIHKVFLEPIQ